MLHVSLKVRSTRRILTTLQQTRATCKEAYYHNRNPPSVKQEINLKGTSYKQDCEMRRWVSYHDGSCSPSASNTGPFSVSNVSLVCCFESIKMLSGVRSLFPDAVSSSCFFKTSFSVGDEDFARVGDLDFLGNRGDRCDSTLPSEFMLITCRLKTIQPSRMIKWLPILSCFAMGKL